MFAVALAPRTQSLFLILLRIYGCATVLLYAQIRLWIVGEHRQAVVIYVIRNSMGSQQSSGV